MIGIEDRMANRMKMDYQNNEILEGILNEDIEIFRYIRHATYPTILKLIKQKNKRNIRVDEVFQDAMIIVWRKLKMGTLDLKCRFTTYFIGVCKTILKFNSTNRNLISQEFVDTIEDEQEIEDLYKMSKEFQLYRKHFNALKPKQKKILLASLSTKPYHELYKDFGYKSSDVLKTEVNRVKKLLIKKITSDPDFKKHNGVNGWSL